MLTNKLLIRKKFRLDLGYWESKYCFNGNQFWYIYEIYGKPAISLRKQIRFFINYMNRDAYYQRPIILKKVKDSWAEIEKSKRKQ